MKNSLEPKKPEDYETAIPEDKKFLEEEVNKMLSGIVDSPPIWLTKNLNKPKEVPTVVKCICPRDISRKNKKKNITKHTRRKQYNGYQVRCPIHS